MGGNMNLKDYAGSFHIHTSMSDGTGSIFDVVEAGHHAGVDFLVITDHNSVAYRTEGFEGWYGKLLVLVGQEVTPVRNHLVVMGVDEVIQSEDLGDAEEHVQRAAGLGGFSVAVHPHHHPHYRRSFWKVIPTPWDNWDKPEIQAVELWSYMADWVHPINLFNPISMIYYIKRPHKAIQGPSASVLAEWDKITQKRQVAAIGGVDAHARRDPLRIFCVFPYEFLFRTIRTHIIAPEFTGTLEDDEKIVLRAFRRGHCYISYDMLHDARGFMFECAGTGRDCIMGDVIRFEKGLTLRTRLPVSAEIRLIDNGREWVHKDGDSLEVDVQEPGVYRIEARLNGQPWVFSNPIYIRANP
jgi:hypothetical protein